MLVTTSKKAALSSSLFTCSVLGFYNNSQIVRIVSPL
jgi:hypothetical protein